MVVVPEITVHQVAEVLRGTLAQQVVALPVLVTRQVAVILQELVALQVVVMLPVVTIPQVVTPLQLLVTPLTLTNLDSQEIPVRSNTRFRYPPTSVLSVTSMMC